MGATERAQSSREATSLAEMEWHEIDRPGCYLFLRWGDLLRIPEEGLTAGRAPAIAIDTQSSRRVARISNDPAEALSVLRRIAALHGYWVNF